MSWPKRIVFVRHGESEGNVKSPDDASYYDKPNHLFNLTENGRRQAQTAMEHLKKKFDWFDEHFCSTFLRTQETMSILCPEAKPIADSRLNELWRGVWYTMPKDQVLALFPSEETIRQREGEYHYRPSGGQNCQDLELMIHSFIQTLRMDYSEKNILIAAHGNWMLLFWRIVLHRSVVEFEERYQNGKYKNGALAVYERQGSGLTLVEDNMLP